MNDSTNAQKTLNIMMKVAAKGGLSIYGLQRMPITLYASQWEHIVELGPQILEFIKTHNSVLARQEEKEENP